MPLLRAALPWSTGACCRLHALTATGGAVGLFLFLKWIWLAHIHSMLCRHTRAHRPVQTVHLILAGAAPYGC